MIYLDHAATTPLRKEALQRMLPVIKEDFGNPDSLHGVGRRAAKYVTDARDEIAGVLGVLPSEVFFTAGGTEADNWAVRMLGRGRVVVSAIEHAAVLSAAPLREGGHAVCPVSEDGIVTETQLGHTMSEDTGLVCVMAVNNETGCVQDIEALSALAHAKGALFFSDCVQAACTQPLFEILKRADAISLSAHKVGGPKGVGALIVKKGTPIRPLIAGGEQERGLRGGTLNVAGIVGFAEALRIAQAEREDFCRHTRRIRDLFEGYLAQNAGDRVCFDGKHRAPNISHLTVRGGSGVLLNVLDLKGVAASGGAACSAHAALPSHVMLAMGRTEAEAAGVVRVSFGRETTEEEALRAAEIFVSALP